MNTIGWNGIHPLCIVSRSARTGRLLASGSYGNTIKLWHLDLEYYLERGCEWLHGYLNNNPNVSEADRGVCDDILK